MAFRINMVKLISAKKAKDLTENAKQNRKTQEDQKIQEEELKVKKYIIDYINNNINLINKEITNASSNCLSSVIVELKDFNINSYKLLFEHKLYIDCEKANDFVQSIFQNIFNNYECSINSIFNPDTTLYLRW